jgi:hypothetical protein
MVLAVHGTRQVLRDKKKASSAPFVDRKDRKGYANAAGHQVINSKDGF